MSSVGSADGGARMTPTVLVMFKTAGNADSSGLNSMIRRGSVQQGKRRGGSLGKEERCRLGCAGVEIVRGNGESGGLSGTSRTGEGTSVVSTRVGRNESRSRLSSGGGPSRWRTSSRYGAGGSRGKGASAAGKSRDKTKEQPRAMCRKLEAEAVSARMQLNVAKTRVSSCRRTDGDVVKERVPLDVGGVFGWEVAVATELGG